LTLGNHLPLFGAFSFFIEENRKGDGCPLRLLGGVFRRARASDVCGLESPPGAGL